MIARCSDRSAALEVRSLRKVQWSAKKIVYEFLLPLQGGHSDYGAASSGRRIIRQLLVLSCEHSVRMIIRNERQGQVALQAQVFNLQAPML